MKRFVPFSEGARDCVGQSLARLNLTTTLAQLLGSFSFRLADEVRLDPSFLSNGDLRYVRLHQVLALELELCFVFLGGGE